MIEKDRLISVLAILGTPVVFFGGLFLTCGLGPMEDDLIQYFPYLAWLGENLRGGEFPLWNALAYGGYSAAGDPQSGIFYPLNWLSALMRVGLAYPILLIIHYWIAGFGMYRLGRQWNLTRLAGTTGALAWMFCGFMLGHRTHYTILAAAAWLSVIFFCWVKVQQSDRPQKYLVAAILAQGMQILAGHVQVAAFSAAALGLYLLVTSRNDRIRMVLFYGLSYALTMGLVAIQLFPVWQNFSESVRSANSFRFVTENSFMPLAWPLLIAPASMGLRVPNFLYEYSYFGPWNHCELNCFTTLAALVLAVFAVVSVRTFQKDPDRRRLIWFFLVLAGIAVFLALGRYNPAFKVLFQLPIFRPFRCPARMFLLFNFAIAVLAMFGIDALVYPGLLARFRRFVPWFIGGLGVVFVGYLWVLFYFSGREEFVKLLPEKLTYIPKSILIAIHPANPALFIPLIAGAVFIVVCRSVREGRVRRAILLVMTLEIATFAPFYDFHFDKMGKADLNPPAARYLDRIAPDRAGLVWPISVDPYIKPLDTLQPFCNLLVNRPTLTGYGPLLNKYQRRLFGWELWPTSGRSLELLTQPEMLTRFGVQYIVADSGNAARIESLREFRPALLGGLGFKQFITASAMVNPGNLFSRSIELSPGLYKLHFRARRNSPDELRVFVSVSGLDHRVWDGQQFTLSTWDTDDKARVFEWYFFVPKMDGREIQVNFAADYGEAEIINVQLERVSFTLDHLVLRGEDLPDGVRVYENTQYAGPAFFAEQIKRMNDTEPMPALRSRAVENLLFSAERRKTMLICPELMELPLRPGTGEVLERKQQANRVTFKVDAKNRPAIFVIPGGYDPGWQVLVDNAETRLLCADGISRAVLVASGVHDISLVYQPGSILTGAAVSLFSVLILVTIFSSGVVKFYKL